MKGKSVLYSITAIGFAGMLIFSSCKKKEDKKDDETPEVVAPSTESGADNRDAQSENDVAIGDINDVIGNSRLAGRGTEASGTQGVTGDICGLTVDSIDIANGAITFSYTGVSCNNRTRTGVIKVSLFNGTTKWRNTGAVLKIEYLNYKVTRTSDKKSITFNGIQYLSNVSGGTWWDLIILKTKTSLVSTISTGAVGASSTPLVLTFSDGKTATYNINRRITYTYPNNIITLTAEGMGMYSGISNLENYGTARNGDVFTSQVTVPIVWNITCGGAVLKGEVNLKNITNLASMKFTYGVDVNGNPVTVGQNDCPYGWKLDWSVSGQSHSKVFGYY
ncbi:MAG: hypothetical protein JNL60_08225 [Bacteroidia bacterium]|nr:hypothetical protein [Bacteroidia bacterium]